MRPARKSQGSESSRFPTQAQLYPLFTHTAKIPEGQAPQFKMDSLLPDTSCNNPIPPLKSI